LVGYGVEKQFISHIIHHEISLIIFSGVLFGLVLSILWS